MGMQLLLLILYRKEHLNQVRILENDLLVHMTCLYSM